MKSSTTCKKFTIEQQREADAEAENEKVRAEIAALEEEVAGWEAACHRAETGYGFGPTKIVSLMKTGNVKIKLLQPANHIKIHFVPKGNVCKFI